MRAIHLSVDYFRDRSNFRENGCWEWRGATGGNGYGSMRSKGKTITPHRAVYKLLHGEIPAGLHVCHRCDNRLCCNPDHLFLGTRSDNMQDCLTKGRFKTPFGAGERAGRAKLTNEQAKAIRNDPRPHRVIAAEYGVDKSAIGHLKRGKTWAGI
jgi:hypothetical protein